MVETLITSAFGTIIESTAIDQNIDNVANDHVRSALTLNRIPFDCQIAIFMLLRIFSALLSRTLEIIRMICNVICL